MYCMLTKSNVPVLPRRDLYKHNTNTMLAHFIIEIMFLDINIVKNLLTIQETNADSEPYHSEPL